MSTARDHRPPRRTVRLRFLFAGKQDIFLDEVPAILRHPYILTFCLASCLLTLLLSFPLYPSDLAQVSLLVPIIAFAEVIGILTVAGWLYLAAALRPRAKVLHIFVTVPLVLGILVVHVITVLLWNVALGVPVAPLAGMVLRCGVIYLFNEAGLALIQRRYALRILADVRALRDDHTHHAPLPLRDGERPHITVNGSAFCIEGLVRLQAQGNYVQITTDDATALVPGPLSALVAQLPTTLGCLVHRSEWVATRAVVSARRDGRATVLHLTDGSSVRVASTRAPVVKDWLALVSPSQSRRRAQSSIGAGDTNRQSRPDPSDSTTSPIGATAPSALKAAVASTKS